MGTSLLDILKMLRVRAGWGLMVEDRSRDGTTVALDPDVVRSLVSVSTMTVVKITGGSGTTHIGDEYGNGMGVPATETGVTIKVLQLNEDESIPAGTFLFAWRVYWPAPTSEDPDARSQFWTVDPARSYGLTVT